MIQLRTLFAAAVCFAPACQTDTTSASRSSSDAASGKASVAAIDMPSKAQADSVPAARIAAPAKPAPAPVAGQESERAQRLAALQKEYDDGVDAAFEAMKQAKTDEEREKASEAVKMPDQAAFRARALALVNEDPADPVALDAITWLMTDGPRGADQGEMLAIVEKHHMQSDELVALVRTVAHGRSPALKQFGEHALESSPHRDVCGNACYALAAVELRALNDARAVQGAKTEAERERLSKRYGPGLGDVDVAAKQAQVEKMLMRAKEEFADVAWSRGTVGQRAEADLFEMHHLAVGMVAPDIEGEDLAGTTFKLSDYRGKVVMLDFWGHW